MKAEKIELFLPNNSLCICEVKNNINEPAKIFGRYIAKKFSPNIFCENAIRACIAIVLSKANSPKAIGEIQSPESSIHFAWRI